MMGSVGKIEVVVVSVRSKVGQSGSRGMSVRSDRVDGNDVLLL